MKRKIKSYLFESIMILSIYTSLFSGVLAKQSYSQEPDFSYKSIELNDSGRPVTLGWRETREISTIQSILETTLPDLVIHPFFQGRLPDHWGVLVDGLWTKSSGF